MDCRHKAARSAKGGLQISSLDCTASAVVTVMYFIYYIILLYYLSVVNRTIAVNMGQCLSLIQQILPLIRPYCMILILN